MYKKWKGKRALVTGASSGIGEEIATQLAASGVHLVLTARRLDRMEATAASLRERHGVEVAVIQEDLSLPEAPRRLFEETEGKGLAVDLLINNAGLGHRGDFDAIEWAQTQIQIQVNVTSLTELTLLFMGKMKGRRSGWILNVASVGGFLPVPGYATYGAGKAYVRSFTEALAEENKGTGVVFSALCPGPIKTEFAEKAGHNLAPWQEASYKPVGPCARAGLNGLHRGKRVVVPGLLMILSTLSLRLVPRRFATWIAGVVMS